MRQTPPFTILTTFVLSSASIQGQPEWDTRIPNSENIGSSQALCIHCHTTSVKPDKGNVNVFGTDWFREGRKWTKELALKDSDGDGETNGVELGDPLGEWSIGETPLFSNFSNPNDPSDLSGNSDGTGTPPSDDPWTVAAPASSTSAWNAQNFVQKIATSLNTDIVNLGADWYWAVTDTYYYLGSDPYIYDQNLGTWFFSTTDDSGIYYFNYSTSTWSWYNRDGSGEGAL